MLLRLVLYVDDESEPFPLEDESVQIYNTQDLSLYLNKILQRPTRLICYWDSQQNCYETLTSLDSLKSDAANCDGGHGANPIAVSLWVETRPTRLDTVDPDIHVDEFLELKAHVRRWAGNAHVVHSLHSAVRVTDPCGARRFDDVRRHQLRGDPDAVELLYYTNNSLSTSDCLENGFYLDKLQPEKYFVFATSMMDIAERQIPFVGPCKVLLCEVAVGNAWPSDVPLSKNSDAPPSGYDSLVYRDEREGRVVRSVRVGRDFQALPRYVLTLLGSKKPRRTASAGGSVRRSRSPKRMVRFSSRSVSAEPSPTVSLSSKRYHPQRRRQHSEDAQTEKHHRRQLFVQVPSKSPLRRSHRSSSRRAASARAPRSRPPPPSSSSFTTAVSSAVAPSSRLPLPPPPKSSALSSLPSPGMTCAAHGGTELGLWCATCRALVCPYCASVGGHAGHEVADVEVVAEEARRRVQSLCHELSMRLDHYRRVRQQIATERAQLHARHREAAAAVEAVCAELRGLIDARRKAWLVRMAAQSTCLDAPLREATALVRRHEEAMAPLERAFCAPTGGRAASTAFLSAFPSLLAAGNRFAAAAPNEALETAIADARRARAVEAALFHVDCTAARRAIEGLGVMPEEKPSHTQRTTPAKAHMGKGGKAVGAMGSANGELDVSLLRVGGASVEAYARLSTSPALAKPAASLGPHVDMACSEASAGSAGTAQRVAVQRRRLLDLRRGYLWCIEDASRFFHPDQRRAVCSRTFTLLDVKWEVRLQTADAAPTNAAMGGCKPGEEPLGLFLYPVEHTRRVDFRVIIFSAQAWAEWEVTGWAPSFVGKGWGVYPLLPRRELMRTDRLAAENTLKVSIVPVSGLY